MFGCPICDDVLGRGPRERGHTQGSNGFFVQKSTRRRLEHGDEFHILLLVHSGKILIIMTELEIRPLVLAGNVCVPVFERWCQTFRHNRLLNSSVHFGMSESGILLI